MLDRIQALEKEVLDLRTEVKLIKQHVKIDSLAVTKEIRVSNPASPIKSKQDNKSIIVESKQSAEEAIKKEKRSLEETFTRALPRIFTVILVLGVLWGLKLVSDYGFLSDSIKILLGFVLSIGLGICAFLMEKKQKGSRVVALSLYGGAFIVGILSTAAGAILYDVLGLYIALLIALVYIVYGVAISYLKGNEALTVLVVFTSLLLPYLLEYMEFNMIIIGIFIVFLFTVVQVVITKHLQRKALYIGMAFSTLALVILSNFHVDEIVFFASALVFLFSVFLMSYLRLYQNESKLHAGVLFSFTLIVLIVLNMMLQYKVMALSILLLLMIAILGFVTYVLFNRKDKLLLDIVATLAALTVLNFIAQLNISSEVILLLLIIFAFAGLLIAVKHGISFMKWVYSFVFTMLGLFVFIFWGVQPILSIVHFTHLVIIAMIVLLYRAICNDSIVQSENKSNISRADILPVIIYVATVSYIWKMDIAHIPTHVTLYLTYVAIAILFVGILLLKRDIVGRLLPSLAGVVYGVAALKLFSTLWVDDQTVIAALVMRLIYFIIAWAILVDVWQHGAIFKNYQDYLERYTEQLTISGIIVSVFVIFSLTNYMNFHELINWNTAVILNTISIFVVACLSLFLAAKRNYRSLKLTGIGLLFFGIIKMIFFDLSTLDLLIRSISFIIIGAIGLVISNKLLDKRKDSV